MFKRLLSLFRVLTRRRDFEEGMSEELRFHNRAIHGRPRALRHVTGKSGPHDTGGTR